LFQQKLIHVSQDFKAAVERLMAKVKEVSDIVDGKNAFNEQRLTSVRKKMHD
jgi:hypothetical protein